MLVSSSLLGLQATSCTKSAPTEPEHGWDVELIAPADGTALRRGSEQAIQVRILDVEDDVGQVLLNVGQEYQRPDGRREITYLLSIPQVRLSTPRGQHARVLPATIECRFVVPRDIEQTGSIPPGSQLLALSASLQRTHASMHVTVAELARYPVVD